MKSKYVKNTIFLLFILYSFFLSAQKNPYLFSSQIDSILAHDSSPYKYQTASWNYSFIGDYKRSIEIKEKQFPNAKPGKPSTEQIELFKKYTAVNAKNQILKEAAKTRIVIINEAHYMSLHRSYLAGLLEDLHGLGYNFIGFEGLSYEDSLINTRKYPVLNSGFYTIESCFGNLIREAIRNEFSVFAYEQKFNDSLQELVGREKAQAMNIMKLIELHPQSKFIIYCGYDHAVEDTLKNFMGLPMAGQLKELSSINPFTIDQTQLSEYFNVGSRFRRLMEQDFDAIYIDSNGTLFNRASFPKLIDCNVYHPNTEYKFNRPTWLITKHTKFRKIQSKIKIGFPCLVKTYLANEDINIAVPFDVIELKSPEDETAILTSKNKKHKLVVQNQKGETQIIEIR